VSVIRKQRLDQCNYSNVQSALMTGFRTDFTLSVWNFCRWVADVPSRETSLIGDEWGEMSAVRRLLFLNFASTRILPKTCPWLSWDHAQLSFSRVNRFQAGKANRKVSHLIQYSSGPHFSFFPRESRASKTRAQVKITLREKGGTRRGERNWWDAARREKFSLFLPCLAFLARGDSHALSRFARSGEQQTNE